MYEERLQVPLGEQEQLKEFFAMMKRSGQEEQGQESFMQWKFTWKMLGNWSWEKR